MANLKKMICEAFCSEVEVKPFRGGLAIGTPFKSRTGERVGLYAVGPEGGPYRLVDNALTMAFLDAEGVTLDNASRRQTLVDLLAEYDAQYDEDMGEIFVEGVAAPSLPKAVLNFAALLLRVNDMAWLATERVRSTFREDIREIFRSEFGGKAAIKEDEPVSPELNEIAPDMVFQAPGRDPVALFIATDDAKLWQAMLLRSIADFEKHVPVSVVAILEYENVISRTVRTKADNRLDAIPRYRDEPQAAIQRVATEILGRQATVH